ncbi:hypothetical protein TEA_024749 [Camellia sinensis var. sinensis]|uniref:START domain-containing protein n=1 Tax=Camellia sinensis var. sinensis TaxID=542762 RepID=A0A4S4EMN8_CAMSN|nr:hypothetical protein TEA_024749 [Camellia sinensis var. sinensis]
MVKTWPKNLEIMDSSLGTTTLRQHCLCPAIRRSEHLRNTASIRVTFFCAIIERDISMVEFMSSEEFESSSSSRGRKRRYRHSPYETQMLETFGQSSSATQNEKTEGHALRAENERLKIENIAAREMLKDEYCKACKGISCTKEDHLHQLRLENCQLNDKKILQYEYLCDLLATMGISVSKNPSLQRLPSIGSSSDGSENFLGKRMRGLSLGSSSNGSENSVDHTLKSQLKQVQDSDTLRMVQTVSNAIDELTSLFIMDRLWIKDPIDGRHIIQRENYEKIFSRTSHLKSSRTRFESSREEAIVRMNGAQLVEMLLDSVYEQVHILSPLVGPRDFYFLRYCAEMGKNEWMIVEVSYDIFDKIESSTQQQDQHHHQPHSSSASPSAPPPSHSWRLPSGCLIRDLNNGCSRPTCYTPLRLTIPTAQRPPATAAKTYHQLAARSSLYLTLGTPHAS